MLSIANDVELDSLSLRQGNPGLVTSSNGHHVLETSGEVMSLSVLEVSDLERSRMLLTVSQDTNTANIVSSGDHAHASRFELDEILDLARGQVESDGIVILGLRIGESDRATVMGDHMVDTLGALLDALDTAELVSGLLLGDLDASESSLGIVKHTEVLLGLVKGDDIHESSRVGVVGANLSINLNQSLNHNGLGLLVVQGVFETVTQQDDERKALSRLVRTCGWLWGPDTGKLIKHPVRRRSHTLHVLLESSRHCVQWCSLTRIYHKPP